MSNVTRNSAQWSHRKSNTIWICASNSMDNVHVTSEWKSCNVKIGIRAFVTFASFDATEVQVNACTNTLDYFYINY